MSPHLRSARLSSCAWLLAACLFTNWNLLSRRLLSRDLGSHLQPGSCSQQHLLTMWASCTAFPTWQFNTCVFFMMRDFVFLIGFEHKAGLISCICRSPQRSPEVLSVPPSSPTLTSSSSPSLPPISVQPKHRRRTKYRPGFSFFIPSLHPACLVCCYVPHCSTVPGENSSIGSPELIHLIQEACNLSASVLEIQHLWNSTLVISTVIL